MDKKTKAKYKRNKDKGIMSCPYCNKKRGIVIMPIQMASDGSYATQTIVCYGNEGGCGKGWTEYWNMTDVEGD